MDLSIIIVNFNTCDLLRACLKSVFSQKGPRIEVWVVDNASNDGSIQMVEKEFPEVKLIKNKKNLGFATANNEALKMAQGKYIFLLNSDTICQAQTLVKIIDFFKHNLQAGVAGLKILNPDGSPQLSAGKFFNLFNTFLMLFGGEKIGHLRSSPLKMKEVDWVSGAAIILRKEVLDKVGLLDDKFFMYMEEVEWCYRIKKAGFKVFFYPETQIIHYERGSGSKSEAIWGIYKGLLYFYQKHKSWWQELILRSMLKKKAILAWMLGVLTGNDYLKATYAKAFRLV